MPKRIPAGRWLLLICVLLWTSLSLVASSGTTTTFGSYLVGPPCACPGCCPPKSLPCCDPSCPKCRGGATPIPGGGCSAGCNGQCPGYCPCDECACCYTSTVFTTSYTTCVNVQVQRNTITRTSLIQSYSTSVVTVTSMIVLTVSDIYQFTSIQTFTSTIPSTSTTISTSISTSVISSFVGVTTVTICSTLYDRSTSSFAITTTPAVTVTQDDGSRTSVLLVITEGTTIPASTITFTSTPLNPGTLTVTALPTPPVVTISTTVSPSPTTFTISGVSQITVSITELATTGGTASLTISVPTRTVGLAINTIAYTTVTTSPIISATETAIQTVTQTV